MFRHEIKDIECVKFDIALLTHSSSPSSFKSNQICCQCCSPVTRSQRRNLNKKRLRRIVYVRRIHSEKHQTDERLSRSSTTREFAGKFSRKMWENSLPLSPYQCNESTFMETFPQHHQSAASDDSLSFEFESWTRQDVEKLHRRAV